MKFITERRLNFIKIINSLIDIQKITKPEKRKYSRTNIYLKGNKRTGELENPTIKKKRKGINDYIGKLFKEMRARNSGLDYLNFKVK